MVRMRWGKAMQPFEGFQLTLTLVPRTHDRDIIRQLATRLVLQLNSTLPTRPVFDSATTARTNALFRTPTCNHPYSAEVTLVLRHLRSACPNSTSTVPGGCCSSVRRTVDRSLIFEGTFLEGSKEISSVEGCPPNAGYHALYILRLHHPANVIPRHIPRQRSSESFSLSRLHGSRTPSNPYVHRV